jgi:Phasin protein
MKEDRDQKRFFKDLGATAEQTVEQVRGVEENYFSEIQKTMSVFPWIADLNERLQSYAEQHFAAALDVAHKLSQAKDFQDLNRLQTEFIQARMQSTGEQVKDFAEAYTKAATRAIEAQFELYSPLGGARVLS